MNIRAEFKQAPSAQRRAGDVRLALHLMIEATPDEAALFAATSFVETATPFPVKLYQFPNKNIVTSATARNVIRDGVSEPVPAFIKARLPIQSYVPGVLLNVPFPGDTCFGYINLADQDRVRTWLETEVAALGSRIADVASQAIRETEPIALRSVSAVAAIHSPAATTTVPITPITVTHEVVRKVGRTVLFAEDE